MPQCWSLELSPNELEIQSTKVLEPRSEAVFDHHEASSLSTTASTQFRGFGSHKESLQETIVGVATYEVEVELEDDLLKVAGLEVPCGSLLVTTPSIIQ